MPDVTTDSNQPEPEPISSQHGRDLTVGSIPKLLILFSLPMLAGNVLQFAYSFVNAIWVGHFLPREAAAAVANSFPVIFVLIPVAVGLTMASNILVAQFMGARSDVDVRRVVGSSVVLVGLLSIVLSAVGYLVIPDLLRWMRVTPDVFPLAVHYLRIFMFTMPLTFGYFLLASLLRGVGDSVTPLKFQAISVLINVALDPVLILGLLGAPKLGLNGAAYASIIAQTVAFFALAIHLQRRRHLVTPNWRHLQVHWPTAWLLVKIGFPSALQQMLVSVGLVFVTGYVNAFGESVTAAFGFAGRIDQLAFFPAMTLNAAVTSLAGQNIGACQYGRVRQIFWWGVLMSGGITVLVSLIAVTLPEMLLHIFTNDALVIQEGAQYLRIVGASYIFFAIMFISNGVINGAGHTFYTTIISLVSVWGVRVWLASYLSTRLGSEIGIWYALAISFGVAMLLSLGYFFSGRWRRSVIHRANGAPAAPPCAKHPPLDSSEQSG